MSPLSFDHLLAMSDDVGIFEHADHASPRLEHGYCTDDVARLLIVLVREPAPSSAMIELRDVALRFLVGAQAGDGKIRNRRSAEGIWHGEYTVDDCWGRALWAFGTLACHAPDHSTRRKAMSCFDRSARQRTPSPRSMAFAALGAAEVLALDPGHHRARQLLADAADTIGPPTADQWWPWPEPRLSYANAALPETLIAAGHLLGRPDVLRDGLDLLTWLLARETWHGHLSPTPVGGAGPSDSPPAFDQQPIEVAAMAEACLRAATVTGASHWLSGFELARGWFAGDNDAGTPMSDPESGGCYDGLHPWGPNRNQGAESSIALVSTLQLARRVAPAAS